MALNFKLRNAGVILLALNCVLLCTAQGGHGGAGAWGGVAGSPGAPGGSDFGYGYGAADSRGRVYGGAGGNGGYYAGGIDDEGRRYSYSGGVGGPGGYPGPQGGIPGAPNAYPNYYDPRYRSSAYAKFTQTTWLWLLLPVAVCSRFL
ncbi:uncharacterized protein [Eurosta solidaginis]|uniref:uncharacterized protein n=1 Tax=Eurosta solidaginis TaxID=178769 RepID=UPI0035305845